MSQSDDILRASEIAQYTFCARAWWLGQVQGYRSTNVAAMREGTAQHRRHGRAVVGYHLLRRVAVVLLVLAVLTLLAWLLLGLGR